MYLSQKIHVNLTAENTAILKQPSKVFNKIKGLFSGVMTPTETQQASVMLSVLQRLNIAHRDAGFNELVSIAINDKLIFESDANDKHQLEQGNGILTDSFVSGEVTKINTLALTIDGESPHLRFLIHVNIVGKPAKNETPVTVNIFAFIKEFKKLPNESEQALAVRLKSLIKSKWGNEQQQQKNLDELESEFNLEVAKLKAQVDTLFPAQSDTSDLQKKVVKKAPKSRNQSHNSRYDDVYFYLPYFYADTAGSKVLAQDDYIQDKLPDWEADTALHDDNSSSWFSGSDSSGDSGSSCGSSCGGGCGS
jgi:hypothetical protein